MRNWIGFLAAMALMTAPVVVQGQGAARASAQQAWLRLELHEPEGLQVPPATRLALAYIPEHLKQPLPTSDDPTAAPEPYVVDPALSPLDIQRWHPEAYDPSVKSERERELEIKYATQAGGTEESQSGLSRQGRIAIGVVVPVVVLTAIAAGATMAAFNNMEIF
jgi:hypothetical protein